MFSFKETCKILNLILKLKFNIFKPVKITKIRDEKNNARLS